VRDALLAPLRRFAPNLEGTSRAFAGRDVVAGLTVAALAVPQGLAFALVGEQRYQAVAEREKGVAESVTNFIVIDALNEGLGSGIMTHGELVRGSQSLSGEIGHMTVNPVDGPPCICGNRGCFESMVSAQRLRGMIGDARARGVHSALFSTGTPDKDLIDAVCDLAGKGDPFCMSLIDDVARWFIVGLGNVIMVNDPELIIIQGQYVKAGNCFLEKLREGIARIGLPDVEKKVRIEYSTLGEERGVLGGAVFMISDFFSKRLNFTKSVKALQG